MSARAWAGLTPTLVATLIAFSAHAGPAEDGNAGLQAMDRGDFVAAARLFSAVIKAPDASPDDREYAYLNLGTIYLRQGRYAQAVANLQSALQLKPDDADARSALDLAQAGKGGADSLTIRWGAVRLLDGGTWVAATSHEDRKHKIKYDVLYYQSYHWTTKGEALAITGSDKLGSPVTGEIVRDPKTGVLTSTTTVNGKSEVLYIQPSLKGYVELSEDGAVRITVTQQDDKTFAVVQETLSNNVWTKSAGYQFINSPNMAGDVDKKAKGRMLRHCLGAGAASGLLTALSGQDQGLPPECGGAQPATEAQQ